VLINTIIIAFKFFKEDFNDKTEELDSFIFVLTKKVKFQDSPILHIDRLQKRGVNFFFSNTNNLKKKK
jgi:hypothetical protein